MFSFIRRHKIALIFLLVLIGLGIFGYTKVFGKKDISKIETATVRKGTLAQTLTIAGTIDAEEKTTLRFPISGKLTWVGVKEGERVKKYQGLASLDKREVEKTLKKKLLAYMNERWDFEQTQDDYNVHGKPMKDVVDLTDTEKRILEKAQFDLESSVLDVEIQNLATEYSFLWTPIDGIVTSIGSPFAGTNITPATAEFEIVNPNTVYFSATADQTEVITLSEGTLGELVLDSYPQATLAGTIKSISFTPNSGESSTVYSVKFVFAKDNNEMKYRIGMGGDVTFTGEKKENVLYLPIKYVKTENGKKYVNLVQDGKTKKQYVSIGLETDDDIEITDGLQTGDVVTVSPLS